MTPTDTAIAPTDTRAELIRDLRTFADMLERFPHLPIGEWTQVRVQYNVLDRLGDEEARIKEVRRVAAMLGVEPEWHENGEGFSANLECGRVEYVVYTAVTP